MSYTKYINNDKDCNYLNAQSQNSSKMLLSCINSGINERLNKRIFQKSSINTFNPLHSQNLEGFTNFTDNGPGKDYIQPGTCPDGFTKDKNGCRQICTHCSYRDNEPESRSMNEFDLCEPEGRFNGFDEYGNIKCINKKNNSSYLHESAYTVDGIFFVV